MDSEISVGGEPHSSPDVLRCSVTELVRAFREALLATLPSAERVLLQWRDPCESPDWELFATAAFRAFVGSALAADTRHQHPHDYDLARYDIDVDSYRNLSWVVAHSADHRIAGAVIRLLSIRIPFDSVQIATVNSSTLDVTGRAIMPFDDTDFAYMRRSTRRPDAYLTEIEADH